jgi:hypothetical protein
MWRQQLKNPLAGKGSQSRQKGREGNVEIKPKHSPNAANCASPSASDSRFDPCIKECNVFETAVSCHCDPLCGGEHNIAVRETYITSALNDAIEGARPVI